MLKLIRGGGWRLAATSLCMLPTSVVAAAITLFSNASNQYVATNPYNVNADPWEYKVRGFDFREVHQPKD